MVLHRLPGAPGWTLGATPDNGRLKPLLAEPGCGLPVAKTAVLLMPLPTCRSMRSGPCKSRSRSLSIATPTRAHIYTIQPVLSKAVPYVHTLTRRFFGLALLVLLLVGGKLVDVLVKVAMQVGVLACVCVVCTYVKRRAQQA